ncbi:unnamed protein product [Fusarium venenatum]|uniref:Uncharacterized protein n=1 Tax=Fusarium venenatum TaxID=56646 RepID=A0A2L2T7T1_9HYPO|nr:uncharacterized protein FVRRES_02490 [Fusarium venenatum]CEI65978.1 unnamed protein product [Fusarium venenatum]
MCIANYIHYHHIPPCDRPITYSYHYTFCAAARYDPITSQPLDPCGSVSSSSPYGDLNDPCSMSQCMVDRRCSSGECRLEDLNGSSFASHSMTLNIRKETGYIQEMKNKIQSQVTLLDHKVWLTDRAVSQ